MRVLLLMTAREVGGAELYVERLVQALAGQAEFTVAAVETPKTAPLLARLASQARVVLFPFDRTAALPRVARGVRALAAQHDVTHINSNHPASRLGILMGFALAGLPHVVVEHSATPVSNVVVPRSIGWALPTLFRWSRRGAARVVTISQESARVLTGHYRLPARYVHVVHPGIKLSAGGDPGSARPALRRELGLDAGARLVLVLARMLPNKGHRYLIDAAPAILAAQPQAHFVFAGPADDPAPLEARIEALGLEQRFSILGFRLDVTDLLAAADVFVLPSLGEGFGLVTLEALGAGLPTVATATGGAPEMIEDGVSGFLVPPRDAATLAGAVERALSLGPARRAAMAAAARASAERFSIEETARQMLELYRAVARGDGALRP